MHAFINSVLSFWATTDPATVISVLVPSAHASVRLYVGHRKPTTVFGVFYRRPENATTYCQICYRACEIRYVPARAIRMYTGSIANLANDFLTKNRTIQELAATCKYAFRLSFYYLNIC